MASFKQIERVLQVNHGSQTSPAHVAPLPQQQLLHLVHDEQCNLHPTQSHRHDPSGSEILAAAGVPINADQRVFQVLHSGGMEDIRRDERANLLLGNVFVIAASDNLFPFTINDKAYTWPFRLVSGAIVAKLAGVDDQHEVELVRHSVAKIISPTDLVDLSLPGIEHLRTIVKQREWKLKVQGVIIKSATPTIVVRNAMIEAGFDITKGWTIFLIVKGHPKQPLTLDSIVDLRAPGIEKIRLMTGNVGNGESQQQTLRREFKLLPVDVEYLEDLDKPWETIMTGERRWLVIRDYELAEGFMPRRVNFALDIPKTYPAAQIDMFYFSPWVTFADGGEIASTQVRETIDGVTYQGWSRHRNAPPAWDPSTDNVMTHMALVEFCLGKELGE
jgi:hypothetical protein